MSARGARLRQITAGPAWSDLNALMSESVQEILQGALMADTDEEAVNLLRQARVAQTLALTFLKRIEDTANTSGE